MTGRTAAMSLDGTPISQTDLDRMAEEERLYSARQRQVARVVAGASHSVDDARMLLDMLGLSPEIIAAARKARSTVTPTTPAPSAAA
jgi:hypothetical protein